MDLFDCRGCAVAHLFNLGPYLLLRSLSETVDAKSRPSRPRSGAADVRSQTIFERIAFCQRTCVCCNFWARHSSQIDGNRTSHRCGVLVPVGNDTSSDAFQRRRSGCSGCSACVVVVTTLVAPVASPQHVFNLFTSVFRVERWRFRRGFFLSFKLRSLLYIIST